MVKKGLTLKSLIIYVAAFLSLHLSTYQNSASLVFSVLSIILISYLTVKTDIFQTLVMCLCSLIFNLSVAICIGQTTPVNAVITTLIAVAPGLICGICFVKNISVNDSVYMLTAAYAVYPLWLLFEMKIVNKINLCEMITEATKNMLNNEFIILKSANETMAELITGHEQEITSELIRIIPASVPAFVILFCLLFAIATYIVCKGICRETLIADCRFVQGFESFYIPKHGMIALLISLIISFAATSEIVVAIAANSLVILFALYFFNGVSFVECKLKQRNINVILRFILIILIFVALTVATFIIPIANCVSVFIILGMIDSERNFRGIGFGKGDEK